MSPKRKAEWILMSCKRTITKIACVDFSVLAFGGCAALSGQPPTPQARFDNGSTDRGTIVTDDFLQAQRDRQRWQVALEKWVTSADHLVDLDTCKEKLKTSNTAFTECVNQQYDDVATASQDAANTNQRLAHDADVLNSDDSAAEYPALGLYAKSPKRCAELANEDFHAFLEESDCYSQANKISKQEFVECRNKADDDRNKASLGLKQADQDTDDALQRLKVEVSMQSAGTQAAIDALKDPPAITPPTTVHVYERPAYSAPVHCTSMNTGYLTSTNCY